MGRLVPEDLPLSALGDDAERRVVEALRDGLTDGWLVLPDVGFSAGQDHQLDVVLVHPRFGVIDLEVKGHQRLAVKEGAFHTDGSRLALQPAAQAKQNAYALRSRLRALGGDLAHVDVEYGVALPNIAAIDGHLPSELHDAQVLTAPDLEEPADAIERLATHRRRVALTDAGVRAILESLRPDANLLWDPEARARAARSRLDDLSAMQVGALETLDANRRVFVTGRAGTGKTRLATRWAQRALSDDQRVLLTCYNDPLAADLEARNLLHEGLVIGAFLRVAFQLAGMPALPVPDEADHEWWNTEAVAHLIRHWHEVTERFDTVVVDEGQDFNPAWLALLEQLLDPDGARRLLIVADDAQDLYARGFRAPSPDDGWTVARLVTNCRNAFPIASILRRHLDGAASPRVGPEGLGVEWLPAEDLDAVTAQVGDALVRLLEHDERAPGSVVVATCTTTVRDHLRAQHHLGRWEDRGSGQVACENVHRIKGLEADTVVLASPDADVADTLLYVGISRAVSQLVLVGPRALAARVGLAR